MAPERKDSIKIEKLIAGINGNEVSGMYYHLLIKTAIKAVV